MALQVRAAIPAISAKSWARSLGAALLVLATQCAPVDGIESDGFDEELEPVTEVECTSRPTAYLMERQHSELALSPAAARLERAGFVVETLPLNRSPSGLHGLILLGTDSAETPEYRDYMERYGSHLYHFVDRANVLVQMPQAHDVEEQPPFLPTTHTAHRDATVVEELIVISVGHPLLGGTGSGQFPWDDYDRARDTFGRQAGFEVLLAQDDSARRGVLLEGAYGQGRMILSALPFDETEGSIASESAARFFEAARVHTESVCKRQTRALDVTFTQSTDSFSAGSKVIAVLPDTQVYSLSYPGLFLAQTAWLSQHAESLSIEYAIHLGDIVNNNTPMEWQRARDAMRLLDGVVPYALVPGNHDYGPSGDASTRDTLLNDFFHFADATQEPSFGGAFQEGRLDNTFHLLSLWGRQFIVMALEWGPRDEVLRWADAVMSEHPNHLGILVTHAYLNHNNRRYDHADTEYPQDYNPHNYATSGGVNDGEEIWQKLVRHHRFVLTLNGHVLGDGTGYLVSRTDAGTNCHQMLVNWQMKTLGGEGNVRLLELMPDQRTVRVHSYSVLHDQLLYAPDLSFGFTIDEL